MSEFFPIASELDSFKSWTVEQKAGLAGNIDLNCTSCRDGFSCCLFESRSPTMLRLRCKDLLERWLSLAVALLRSEGDLQVKP